MSCSKILFIYDPGSQSEPDHLPPPLLSLMPSMNLWWSAFFVTLVNSYSDSDIIAPKPKWFWVTINFFLNFLFIFFSLLKSSKRKDNETCVRFAVWWSDSDQTAALKVKLNVLNRTQLHHSRVSLAGCLLLRLWPGSSSAAADSLRYLAAEPGYLALISLGYLAAAPGYHCNSPYNALLLQTVHFAAAECTNNAVCSRIASKSSLSSVSCVSCRLSREARILEGKIKLSMGSRKGAISMAIERIGNGQQQPTLPLPPPPPPPPQRNQLTLKFCCRERAAEESESSPLESATALSSLLPQPAAFTSDISSQLNVVNVLCLVVSIEWSS